MSDQTDSRSAAKQIASRWVEQLLLKRKSLPGEEDQVVMSTKCPVWVQLASAKFKGQTLLSRPHLFSFLVKDGRHGQDGGALVKRSSKTFPVLIQLTWDLFYLCGGVVAGLGQAARHWHDSVDVYIGILGKKTKHQQQVWVCWSAAGSYYC